MVSRVFSIVKGFCAVSLASLCLQAGFARADQTLPRAEQTVPPNPQKQFTDKISDFSIDVLKSARDQQSSSKSQKAHEQIQKNNFSEDDYLFQMATMREKDDKQQAANGDAFAFLQDELQRAAITNALNQFPIIKEIQKGMAFDIRLFGAKKSKKQSSKKVKYGLVLQDIKTKNSGDSQAAIGSEYDPGIAGQAYADWTIGPITEETRVVFENHEAFQSEESFYSTLPRLDFSGTGQMENVDKLVSGQREDQPNFLFKFKQSQGYYSNDMRYSLSGRAISQFHTLRLPVIRQMAISKTYDASWREHSTTLHKVLTYNHLPTLNVTFQHLEELVTTELVFAMDNDASVKFKSENSASSTYVPNSAKQGSYRLELSRDF